MADQRIPAPIGKRYGRLVITGYGEDRITERRRGNTTIPVTYYMWAAKCDCGRTIEALSNNIRGGRTTSCGKHRDVPNHASNPTPRYANVQIRLRKARGTARSQTCSCGARAKHWVYLGGCRDEYFDFSNAYQANRPLCRHVEHYEAMCHPCRNRKDDER